MPHDMQSLFRTELREMANRISDRALRDLRSHGGVNQFGETRPGSMEGQIQYGDPRTEGPRLVYYGQNAKYLNDARRTSCGIEFWDLRTKDDEVDVAVQDLDIVPKGRGKTVAVSYTNPTDVEFEITAKTEAEEKESTEKSASASATASLEYHREAEAKAGIKIAEASAKESLTAKLETTVHAGISSAKASGYRDVSGRKYTVPGFCTFRLAITWDEAKVNRRVKFKGLLECTPYLWAEHHFDARFDNFHDMRECFRGLRGNKYGQLSEHYQAHPMSDADIDDMLSIPYVEIEVDKPATLASNTDLVAEQHYLPKTTRPEDIVIENMGVA